MPGTGFTADLARAARLLLVRSRREATGLFAGNYASAFRGGGLEFEESRPYAPGDDVRSIDWNATARSGETFVKRFREERNQTLLFAFDVSASMGFACRGVSKAATAAHALGLLVAAAARAGDRTGLVVFDASLRGEVPIGRGVGHGARVVHAAVAAADAGGGPTRLAVALRALRTRTRRHAVIVLLSDFRDPDLPLSSPEPAPLAAALSDLARRHDVVATALVDPLELELPRAGVIRVTDPERPGEIRLLDTGSRRSRRLYLAACGRRRQRLEQVLRRCGADVLWLRTDRSPLFALGRFFRERAERRARPAA